MLEDVTLFECKAILLLNAVIIDFYETSCSNNVGRQPFILVCQSVIAELRGIFGKYETTSIRTDLWLQVILIFFYSFSVYIFPLLCFDLVLFFFKIAFLLGIILWLSKCI